MKGKGITLATLLDTGLGSECMCINHSSLDLPLALSTVWATLWRCGPFCDLQTHTHTLLLGTSISTANDNKEAFGLQL